MSAIGFFRSPTGTAVTWDENGQHTDTGQPYEGFQLPSAQPQYGFFSTNEADNALANRGAPSVYNQWSDMPANTYAAYVAKMNAAKGNASDPLAAWLTAGSSPMSEQDWNAQQARAAASPNTWGGGDTAASAAAQAARTAALPSQTVQNHQLPDQGPFAAVRGALSQASSLVNPAGPAQQPTYSPAQGALTQFGNSDQYQHLYRPDQQGPWMNFHSDGQPSGPPIEFHPQPRSSLYAASSAAPATQTAQGALTQSGG